MADEDHYLKTELYELLQKDPRVFEFLQQGSLDGLWYWDLENPENEWMNPQFWGTLGYYPAEKKHLASEWQDLIHPDDLKVALSNSEKHFTDPNHPYDQIVRYRHKNGSTVWVRCRGIAIRDQKGKPVRMLGAHTDMTHQKMAEEALRESERTLRGALDGLSAHIALLDEKGTILLVNRAWRMFAEQNGTAPETVSEKADYFAVCLAAKGDRAEGAEAFVEGIRRVLAKELTHFKMEYPCHSPDAKRWFVVHASLFPGDGPRRVVVAHENITDRKIAEEELKNRESQLRKVFEIMPVGLWFADREGRLLRGNPAGVRIWGAEPRVSPSEYGVFKARRLPSGEEVHPDDWALARTIREGVTVLDELLEIDAFDGRKKKILNYTAPVRDEKGGIQGAIVVNQDITEREDLQMQLLQAQKIEAIGTLAGGIAHDFNNKIGVILGNTDLALDLVQPSEPLHDYLMEIQKAAGFSADLTRQLLAFARKQTIIPKVLDLNDTVESMLKMLRRLIGENIHLAWIPGNELGRIYMDPSQVDQILANLCVNARDAISGVGKVTIETGKKTFDQEYCSTHFGFKPGEYVMLAVSDDGCGISRETLRHLFEPFFTTKGIGRGTGLGLSTVYGIVKQNNGFINVYSEPGQGTTFTVYLPPCTETGRSEHSEDRSESMLNGSETILLVEDDPAILKLNNRVLTRRGYHVLAANTPGEALRLAANYAGPIHLLITDVVMPEMNGQQLSVRLAAHHPDLHVIFVSGYTANVIAHHGVLDQGVDFIQKPFSANVFLAKIREILDRRKRPQKAR